MTVQAPGNQLWKLTTGIAAGMAIVCVFWGSQQSQRADLLAQRAAQLQQTADQLTSQVQDAQQQVSVIKSHLQEESKPDLPLSVTFRSAMLGPGLVAMFRNNSSNTIEVSATFSSPDTATEKEAKLVIPANSVQAIGHSAGWSFAPGQHIRLVNGRFRTVEYTVPGA